MNQPRVLIVTDDPEFSRALVERWSRHRPAPPLTIVGSQTPPEALPASDIAVVGGLSGDGREELLSVVTDRSALLIFVSKSASDVDALRQKSPRLRALQRSGAWDEAVVTLAEEAWQRKQAERRAVMAEDKLAQEERLAALGRYMLEMRHGFSNALTSVLGNSELLLDGVSSSEEARGQLETIHAMSLRMHEILQRFSSLDKELQCTQKKAQGETGQWPKSAVAGI